MELVVALKNSIILPSKKAVFRLNRISMRDTIVYMFLLIVIALSPIFIFEPLASAQGSDGTNFDLLILQLVVLYPFLCMFLGIVGISLLSALGLIITILLKRKLAYQQLWKMSVFAVTTPLLVYFVLSIFKLNSWQVLPILLLLFYIVLYFMIIVYPKRRK